MPPRERRGKKRRTRMDAAIDALEPLGFSKSLVRKRVNKLLTIYGVEESWRFIEEDSYRVLIDSFLDEQEESMAIKGTEDKKDEPSNEGGGLVPFSPNGNDVPIENTYELVKREVGVGVEVEEDDNDEDEDEWLSFEQATKESDIICPRKTQEKDENIIITGGSSNSRSHGKRPMEWNNGGTRSERGMSSDQFNNRQE